MLPRILSRSAQAILSGRAILGSQILARNWSSVSSVRVLNTAQLEDCVQVELRVNDRDPVRKTFHNIWLRDSCQCPSCYSSDTHQRLFDTSQISANVQTNRLTTDSNKLTIHWDNGHLSTFTGEWLLKNSFEEKSDQSFERVSWGSEIGRSPPLISYSCVMNEGEGVLELYRNMEIYGFCLVEATPTEEKASEDLINRVAAIRYTLYGGFCVIEANLHMKDTAYSNVAIDPHTDSNYLQDPPGMLLFHTLKFEGPEPAYNYLVDGQKLSETIKAEHPDHFEILSNIPLAYHYWDQNHKYTNSFVTFKMDQDSDKLLELHFNNHDRLPVPKSALDALKALDPTKDLSDIYAAIQTVIRTSKRRDLLYELKLEPGLALILDNHRLMHARSDFQGHRVLVGTYMNKEDMLSTVRSIRDKM